MTAGKSRKNSNMLFNGLDAILDFSKVVTFGYNVSRDKHAYNGEFYDLENQLKAILPIIKFDIKHIKPFDKCNSTEEWVDRLVELYNAMRAWLVKKAASRKRKQATTEEYKKVFLVANSFRETLNPAGKVSDNPESIINFYLRTISREQQGRIVKRINNREGKRESYFYPVVKYSYYRIRRIYPPPNSITVKLLIDYLSNEKNVALCINKLNSSREKNKYWMRPDVEYVSFGFHFDKKKKDISIRFKNLLGSRKSEIVERRCGKTSLYKLLYEVEAEEERNSRTDPPK